MGFDPVAFWKMYRATSREEYKRLEHTEVMDHYAEALYRLAVGGRVGRDTLKQLVEATSDSDERLFVIEYCRDWVVPIDFDSDFGQWLAGIAREIDGGLELLDALERFRQVERGQD